MNCFRLDAPCKTFAVAIMTATLLGCATVKDIASQTPIISMAYDGLQAYHLIDLATLEDSMTSNPVRSSS